MTGRDSREPSAESAPGVAREAGADPEPGLEDRLRRIDEIVAALDSDALGLDQALALFEEGVAHVAQARRILTTAELKVEELIGPAGDGRREMTPADGAAPTGEDA